MPKKVLLAVTAVIAVILGIILIYKILALSAKPSAVPPFKPSANIAPSAAAMKIEKASKEEADLFELASRYQRSGDLLNARDTYRSIIEKFPASNNIRKAQAGLEDMNISILFSSIPTPDSLLYEVQKGDTLSKIAKKFSNTQDMVLAANGLKNPKVVPLGRKLKVHNEKFSIIIDKSQNILTLKSGDGIIKTYRVSTGINNCTPVGNFKIINKVVDPPWYTAGSVVQPDNPKNILGSRWLGLSAASYGIHGTTEPQSIGKQVTSGCVRLTNSDVEELYRIVPEGTEVVVVD